MRKAVDEFQPAGDHTPEGLFEFYRELFREVDSRRDDGEGAGAELECLNCGGNEWINTGHVICPACGADNGPVLVHEVVRRGEDDNKVWVTPTHKKRSVYDQGGSMRDKLLEYNISKERGEDYRDKILEDFQKVQGALNGKNISSYDYYILRLPARRGIQIIPLPKEEVRHRENYQREKMVTGSIRGAYKRLPYNKKRQEEMWVKIREELEKLRSGEIEAKNTKNKTRTCGYKDPKGAKENGRNVLSYGLPFSWVGL